MPLARVVSFEDVSADRMTELAGEIEGGRRPEGLPATEIVVLHDPEAERSLVVMFFDTEEDYVRGDQILNAMPSDETPGRRVSATKHEVAVRRMF